jgi:DNA sulfur modification protein DndB
VLERLRGSGQPAVIVIDDNPLHRAQDFTDLRRNAKPPTGSLSLSMDRRQPINRLIVDLVQQPDVPIFDKGDRVEFLKDSPGKFSAKLFSFKTVRYMSGTALIGTKERSTRGWENAVNEAIKTDSPGVLKKLGELWQGLGQLPDLANVIDKTTTVAELREKSLLTAAGVQYAIAQAIYRAITESKLTYLAAAQALKSVNFDRPKRDPSEASPLTKEETPFAGTLIDPLTGKMGAGRPRMGGGGR